MGGISFEAVFCRIRKNPCEGKLPEETNLAFTGIGPVQG